MDKIKLLERIDILRALYNSYKEKTVMSEINIDYYKYKKESPRNGDDIKKIEANLVTAQRNVVDYEHMCEIILKKIKQHDSEQSKMN